MNPLKENKRYIALIRGLHIVVMLGLLVGVYHETGLWTTLLLSLLVAELEFKNYLFRELSVSVQWLASIVVQLVKAYQVSQEDKNEDNQED